MYQPKHFEEHVPARLHAFAAAHPLAQIVHVAGDGSLTADAIPLMWVDVEGAKAIAPHGRLIGHVARANPLWSLADQHGDAGLPVLALFQGDSHYVSPSWYPTKAQHGKVVPTWNYSCVHAHGRLRTFHPSERLLAVVDALTRMHEASQPKPWALSDAPPDYIAQMLKAIVGIEVTIERLEGKFKQSQNRSAADRAGVAAGRAEQAATRSR